MSGMASLFGGAGFSPLSLIGPLLSLAMGSGNSGGNAPAPPAIPAPPPPAPVPAPVALPTVEPVINPDTSVTAAQASAQTQKRAALNAQSSIGQLNQSTTGNNQSNSNQRSLLGS